MSNLKIALIGLLAAIILAIVGCSANDSKPPGFSEPTEPPPQNKFVPSEPIPSEENVESLP